MGLDAGREVSLRGCKLLPTPLMVWCLQRLSCTLDWSVFLPDFLTVPWSVRGKTLLGIGGGGGGGMWQSPNSNSAKPFRCLGAGFISLTPPPPHPPTPPPLAGPPVFRSFFSSSALFVPPVGYWLVWVTACMQAFDYTINWGFCWNLQRSVESAFGTVFPAGLVPEARCAWSFSFRGYGGGVTDTDTKKCF